MANLTIDKVDESKIAIYADSSVLQHMWEFFSFYAKDYKYSPLYKANLWDGKIRLVRLHNRSTMGVCGYGLIYEVIKFARDFEYSIDLDPDLHLIGKNDPVPVDVVGLFKSFNLDYDPYDFQVSAVEVILNHRRSLILSPTSSGKSLIIYASMRELLRANKRVLVVVPTTGLVEQLVSDFEEYSEHNDFDAEATCHKIYSGKEKVTKKPVVVTTWQSITSKRKKWFDDYDAVFVDEAHGASAKSLIGIMDKCVNAEYRIGLTGTIEDGQTHKYTLMDLFGHIHTTITTKEMIDREIVSNLTIKCLNLIHPRDACEQVATMNYEEELDYIISHETRNELICKMALNESGNTLVLFRFVDRHGIPLREMMESMNNGKKTIFYVDKDVKTAKREEIRKYAENNDGVVIIASYGTFSTGINIKNLHCAILAHPLKSKIKILQSIGRILRKSKFRDMAIVIDVSDEMTHKLSTNRTLEHFKLRLKQYAKAGFKITYHRMTIR